MKIKNLFLLGIVLLFTSVGFVSCSDDDFEATIFDITEKPLDKTVFTFPLDTFVKVNFLEPYNLKYIYKMEDIGSDMQKNLTPAKYENSLDLAVLLKYLWIDVYNKFANEDNSLNPSTMMKECSPRILHIIGSKNHNPTTGTETLGDASGGLKINLYNVNSIEQYLYESNIEKLNEYFFKTIHHEFGHILHQHKIYPTAFREISRGYDAADWSNKADSIAAGLGFVSPYASSKYDDDWVETLALYLVSSEKQWNIILGSAQYDWEENDIASAEAYYNLCGVSNALALEQKLLSEPNLLDTIGYYRTTQNGESKIYRRVCVRDGEDNVVYDEDGNVQWLNSDGIEGDKVILQKLDMVRNWLKEGFGVDLDNLRDEVQNRMYAHNADGSYKTDARGNYILSFSERDAEGVTLLDRLRQQVTDYEKLMIK